MTEPLMHVIKYEVLAMLRQEGFQWSDSYAQPAKLYRHCIIAHYQEYSLFIVRNYKDGIARQQTITVVNLDDDVIFESILVGDAKFCDTVAEAITAIKIRCKNESKGMDEAKSTAL